MEKQSVPDADRPAAALVKKVGRARSLVHQKPWLAGLAVLVLAAAGSIVTAVRLSPPTGTPQINDVELIAGASQNSGYEASPAVDVVSVKTKDRVVLINSKPAFLFGAYEANDDWAINTLGANVFMDVGPNINQDALAQRVKGRAWVLRHSEPGLKLGQPYPNEIGTAWTDEPLDNGITVETNPLHAQDGRLNFQNYPADFGSTAINDNNGVARYLPLVDQLGPNALVTYDLYIQNIGGTLNGDSHYSGLGAIYQFTSAEKQALNNKPQVPFGAYIETTQWLPKSLPVTPAIVVGEAKAAVTAGATMINWWDRMGDVATDSTPPETSAAIRDFVSQVHRMAPILLGKQMDGLASTWDDQIKVGGRITHTQSGQQIYNVILFNSTDHAVAIDRKLPGLDRQRVREAVSGKELTVQQSKVKATIPAYDWIIASYVVQP